MGDYSLGHFNFTLKKDTPNEVIQFLKDLLNGRANLLLKGEEIYRGQSCYHDDPDFGYMTTTPTFDWNDESLYRFAATFQIKYGRSNLRALAEYIAPYVVINKQNNGFIGYSICESSHSVTAFIVDENGILKG